MDCSLSKGMGLDACMCVCVCVCVGVANNHYITLYSALTLDQPTREGEAGSENRFEFGDVHCGVCVAVLVG